MSNTDDIKRYFQNRQKEIDGAALYSVLAETEKQPQMAEIYRRLSASEEKHAAGWEKKLEEFKVLIPPRKPTWRAAAMIWLAKRFGPQFVLPTITSNEKADSQAYDNQPDIEASEFSRDEKSHARLLSMASHSTGGLSGGSVAQLEGRHKASGGNALRAAVLGANDGLVSTLSLVMGVAGLLAGACSMAMGEWLSVQSARELNQRQLAVEAEEIEQVPEEEQQELALIYEAKGLTEDEATAIAAKLMADKDSALDALAREELGIDPQDLGGSAWAAASTSFVLFAGGALVPVAPFLYLTGTSAVMVSLLVSALALFLVGAAITLFTGRSVLATGLRQLLFGAVAAGVTYGIGRLLGVTLAG